VTRYAVGDVQGCFEPLRRLLDQVKFDPTRDRLWAVGDLVNRGPQSLESLRFFRDLGDSARVVLGNHDLHLLAVAAGIRKLKRSDTLQPILDAPDAADLLEWVARQPLFYREHDYAMVHAGLAPQWSLDDAARLSAEVSTVLAGPQRLDYLNGMYGDEPDHWSDALKGPTRWRVITNYFTRMRFCNAEGALNLTHKDGPETAPPGFMPWFNAPYRRSAGSRIIFGHWASLMGRSQRNDAIALDTGCIWGNKLSLFTLDTHTFSTCACP
jgi:bis(5'-nucleosyl)-tetraphosphatase (symmetrical)